MITAEQALSIARDALISGLAEQEFAFWPDGAWGTPIMVQDTNKQPSYWLVPYRVADRVVGFGRVLAAGRLLAIGTFGMPGRPLDAYPKVVTGIAADEAERILATMAQLEAGETASAPIFVHDGPPGREIWLVETTRNGRPYRWIFISAAGWYERPAGTTTIADQMEA